MIISPKEAHEKKMITSDSKDFSSKQFQPNGIDVRIKKAWKIVGDFVLCGAEEVETKIVPVHEMLSSDPNGFFLFEPFVPYGIECFERVSIPDNVVAMVYGRSTLNRNGIFIRSSLYDSNFNNFVGFTMYPWVETTIECGSRIAQIVFMSADSDGLYGGQYQGKETD